MYFGADEKEHNNTKMIQNMHPFIDDNDNLMTQNNYWIDILFT